MICRGCKSDTELRLGYCFDCASIGEERAAKRTVLQHLNKMRKNLLQHKWKYAQYDLSWAWQRLTRTGDYSDGGTFDWEKYNWR